MPLDITLTAVLLAGALSFLSPCVLPLVPPYLCFISGLSLDEMSAKAEQVSPNQKKVVMAALAFVLGFTTVFVLLGAGASSFGQMLRAHLPLLAQIAGIFIIVMGLNFLGVFRISLFSREARYHQSSKPVGLFGAYAVGLAFAFGWTPCIGPVLAAVLSVAAQEASVSKGMGLLALYSLGLGIPFLLAAFSVDRFLRFSRRFRGYIGTVERVMGGLLVLTGVMFLTGHMQAMSYWLLETFPVLGNIG
jgi:cytochrome c-type biogenesis protein